MLGRLDGTRLGSVAGVNDTTVVRLGRVAPAESVKMFGAAISAGDVASVDGGEDRGKTGEGAGLEGVDRADWVNVLTTIAVPPKIASVTMSPRRPRRDEDQRAGATA